MTGDRIEREKAEIDEEIAFHLQESARALVRDGVPEGQATEVAHRRFGDIATVRRATIHERLWNDIMIQRAHLALTALLLVGLTVLVAQRSAASRAYAGDIQSLEAKIDALVTAVTPSPEPVNRLPARVNYDRLAVGDVIDVVARSGGSRDIQCSARIHRDGMILLPWLGWVPAEGLDRVTLREKLEGLYAEYFIDALELEIVLVNQVDHRVAVLDEVIVRVGDQLEVLDEVHKADLNVAVTVDRTGATVLPELGMIEVAGRSRPELEAFLTERYSLYFAHKPVIRVRVVGSGAPGRR